MAVSLKHIQLRKRSLRGKELSASQGHDLVASAVENSARHVDLTESLPHIECGKAFESCRKFRRRKLLRLFQIAHASLCATLGQGTLVGKFIEHGAGISLDTDPHRCECAGIDATMVLACAHAWRGGNQHHCGNLFG
jgi:hypothetical protein